MAGPITTGGKLSWADRRNNEGYKNWLRVGIALQETRDGLIDIARRGATELHNNLKTQLGDSTRYCNCKTWRRDWGCQCCWPWRRELETYYEGNRNFIYWTNCYPKNWSKDPWEVAKVFMPRGQTAANKGPQTSDPSALLNFLVHCNFCHKYVSPKSSQEVIYNVIGVRNSTMHSADLSFDQSTFQKHMDTLLRLMDDPMLTSDPAVQKAAERLRKIRTEDFHIGADTACRDAELRVLKDLICEHKKVLDLHTQQLGDHETRLGTMEQRIMPVEEALERVNAISSLVNNNSDLYRSLSQEVTDLSETLNQYKDRLGQLELTVAEQGAQVEEVTTRLGEVEDGMSQIEQTVAEQGTQFKEVTTHLQEDIGNVREDVTQLQRELEARVEEVNTSLQEDIDAVREDVTEVQREFEAQGTRTEEVTARLQEDISHVTEEVTQVQRELEAQEARAEEVTTRLQEDISGVREDVTRVQQNLQVPPDREELKSAFINALSTKYKNTLNILKPLPWNDRFILRLDDVYTTLRLDDVVGMRRGNQSSERLNILVTGEAGSGKSTLLSKLALTWSHGKGIPAETDMIVLLVRLREVEEGESIEKIVWDQCVTKSAEGMDISSIPTFLRDNESKLVFLLDGYDELDPDAKGRTQAVPELLSKTCYPASIVIVTSRPNSGIRQHMAVTSEEKIVGFPPGCVDKYVSLYFETVGMPGLADSLIKALQPQASVVERSLIQTPMFLMLICVLWEDSPDRSRLLPGTMSGLYQELLTCVIRKYCVRDGLPMHGDEVPPVVSTALLHLGRLALESLLRGESLVELKEAVGQQDMGILLKLGIVSKEVSASRLHPRTQLNFPHKTMQEFLAGRYVAHTVNANAGDLSTLVPLDSVPAVLQQSNLVQFICGCGGKVTGEMLSKLSKVEIPFEPAPEIDMIQNMMQQLSNPLLLFGTVKKVPRNESIQHLCLMSLFEGQDFSHFPYVSRWFSLLDLTVYVPSREGEALKYYLKHAATLSSHLYLTLGVQEASEGGGVEYLSCLVEKPLPNLRLYLSFAPEHKAMLVYDSYDCFIGDMLFKLIPFLTNVPSVELLNFRRTNLTPKSLQALGRVLPTLTMLKTLDLSDNPDIGDAGIKLLCEMIVSPIHLTDLKLQCIGVGDDCLSSLAGVLHLLPSLRTLDLSKNNIGDSGLEPFAAIQQPVASLKLLILSDNKIGDALLRSLAGALHYLPSLKGLYLYKNNIGNEDMEPFAAIQCAVSNLKVLNLSSNKIGDVCMRSLAAVLHHLPCLEVLIVDNNSIGDTKQKQSATHSSLACNPIYRQQNLQDGEGSRPPKRRREKDEGEGRGMKPFAAIQQSVVSLKELILCNNMIGDVCLRSLAGVLHLLPSLETLDLSYNRIGDSGLEPFAAIQQPVVNLITLNLSHNWIWDDCLRSLAGILHHLSSLKTLDLSYNMIGDNRLEPFAAVEQPIVSLKTLNLTRNRIEDVCLGSLVAVLHHFAPLIELDLSFNRIRDGQMAALAAALYHLPCLLYVRLNDNPISLLGIQNFAQNIQRMPALKGLYLLPRPAAHLDHSVATSISNMLTRLPGLQELGLENISLQPTGFLALVTAVDEHPALDKLLYSWRLVPEEISTGPLSSKIKYTHQENIIHLENFEQHHNMWHSFADMTGHDRIEQLRKDQHSISPGSRHGCHFPWC